MVKGNTENFAAGFFIFCFHNFKIALKGWIFWGACFIREINSIVQSFWAFAIYCKDGYLSWIQHCSQFCARSISVHFYYAGF